MSDHNRVTNEQVNDAYNKLFWKPQKEYVSRIRLFITDMEGTVFQKIPSKYDRGLVAASAWPVLQYRSGPLADKLEGRLQKEWVARDKKKYGKFVSDSVKVMQYCELGKKTFVSTMEEFDFQPGVIEAMKQIKDLGIYTGLVTGGFQYQADKAQAALKLDSVTAAVKLYWDKEGNIDHWNSLPWDQNEKIHFVESLIYELDTRWSEVAYIGDSTNDKGIWEKAGLKILMAPPIIKPEDFATWTDEEKGRFDKRIRLDGELREYITSKQDGHIVEHWSEVPSKVRSYVKVLDH